MKWLIQLWFKNDEFDSKAKNLKSEIEDFIKKDVKVRIITNYILEGNISKKNVEFIVKELILDKTLEEFEIKEINKINFEIPKKIKEKNIFDFWIVSVLFKKNVTNPEDEIILKNLKFFFNEIKNLKLFRIYLISKNVYEKELNLIIKKILSNELIHDVYIGDKKYDYS